jgi:cytochrome c
MKLIAAAMTALSVVFAAGSISAADDNAKGKRIFKLKCIACHSLTAGTARTGPSLNGIFGRTAGSWQPTNSHSVFLFSRGMRKAGKGNKKKGIKPLVWTSETLKKFLATPRTFPPKVAHVMKIKKAADRNNLIAYLKKATK